MDFMEKQAEAAHVHSLMILRKQLEDFKKTISPMVALDDLAAKRHPPTHWSRVYSFKKLDQQVSGIINELTEGIKKIRSKNTH